MCIIALGVSAVIMERAGTKAGKAMADRTAYGGQAVIEGVMIRGRDQVATACRLPDGSITVRRDLVNSAMQRNAVLRLPFFRGTPALFESLQLGYRTLMWSADIAMEGEGQEKPNELHYALAILSAMVVGIGGFVLLPNFLAHLPFPAIPHAAGGNVWLQFLPSRAAVLPNILEGVIRIVMLVGYILLIGRGAEIRRVFAYHGAEHKVVNAWEGGAELTVEGAKPYSRIHPRCGTSFLFLFFVVGILIHGLIGWQDNRLLSMATRLVLLFPVAGVSYELLRLAGRQRNSQLLKILVWPGMMLQQLTTAEPEDDQIEVAIRSMRHVLEGEGELEPEAIETAPLGPELEAAVEAPQTQVADGESV